MVDLKTRLIEHGQHERESARESIGRTFVSSCSPVREHETLEATRPSVSIDIKNVLVVLRVSERGEREEGRREIHASMSSSFARLLARESNEFRRSTKLNSQTPRSQIPRPQSQEQL